LPIATAAVTSCTASRPSEYV